MQSGNTEENTVKASTKKESKGKVSIFGKARADADPSRVKEALGYIGRTSTSLALGQLICLEDFVGNGLYGIVSECNEENVVLKIAEVSGWGRDQIENAIYPEYISEKSIDDILTPENIQIVQKGSDNFGAFYLIPDGSKMPIVESMNFNECISKPWYYIESLIFETLSNVFEDIKNKHDNELVELALWEDDGVVEAIDGGLSPSERKKMNKKTGSNLKDGVRGNWNDISDSEKKRWISWASRHYCRKELPDMKKNGKLTPMAKQARRWGEPAPENKESARKICRKAKKRSKQLDDQ